MSQPSTRPTHYKGYRFPPEIISRCVWLYYRFGVSLRDVYPSALRGFDFAPPLPRISLYGSDGGFCCPCKAEAPSSLLGSVVPISHLSTSGRIT
jgi:hypothetical protein